jgi:hypothetical protein
MSQKEDIAKKFEHLYRVISTEKFLSMQALGGEIPFFISAYYPKQELEVVKAIRGLKNKLETNGISVLEINLYDLSLEIINSELGEAEIFELEKTMTKDEFKSALQSLLEINEVLMPAIKQKISAHSPKVLFVTGVGAVYPFIRSHNVLNNLQNVAKNAPTLMFFSGTYNGQSLELFGLLKDDNYYRAFNIDNYKL